MLNIYTVSFFGHREVERFSYIDAQVFSLVRELIMTKEYVDFLIGRNGEFDQIVSSAINRVKRNCRDDNSGGCVVQIYDDLQYNLQLSCRAFGKINSHQAQKEAIGWLQTGSGFLLLTEKENLANR